MISDRLDSAASEVILQVDFIMLQTLFYLLGNLQWNTNVYILMELNVGAKHAASVAWNVGSPQKRPLARLRTNRGTLRNEGTTTESQDTYGTWPTRNLMEV